MCQRRRLQLNLPAPPKQQVRAAPLYVCYVHVHVYCVYVYCVSVSVDTDRFASDSCCVCTEGRVLLHEAVVLRRRQKWVRGVPRHGIICKPSFISTRQVPSFWFFFNPFIRRDYHLPHLSTSTSTSTSSFLPFYIKPISSPSLSLCVPGPTARLRDLYS